MKRKFIWFFKAFVALLVAFCIMSGFCAFYYNLPIHYTNPSGVTDYFWEKGSYSVKCTEGFAKVRTDDNGFVNTYEPKGEKIDALIMGSSHTEAFNVGEKENYIYLLNDKFSDDENQLYFYNIGISGHTLPRCLRNLERAVGAFNPQKYIIIETVNVNLSLNELESVKNDTLDYLPSHNSGLIYYLQKSNLFRRLYAQLSNVLENEKLPTLNISGTEKTPSTLDKTGWSDGNVMIEYGNTLDAVLKRSSEIAKDNGCKLIVAYIPQLEIDYNGNIVERKSLHIRRQD